MSLSLNNLKKNLRNLIASAQTEDAINLLLERVVDTSFFFDEIYEQSGRFNSNQRKKRQIGITHDTDIEDNEIRKNLMQIIAKLKESDVTDDNQKLREEIAALRLSCLPPWVLVNCNRLKTMEIFAEAFLQQGERPYQFYFFAACNAHKPDSFAERVIYELVQTKLRNDEKAINYDRTIESIGKYKVEKVLVKALPFAPIGGIEDCKFLFNDYLEKRFHRLLADLPDYSISTIATMPSEVLPIRFFTFVFRIDLEVLPWNNNILPEYLAWVIETFRQNRTNMPAFQFIFVINSNNLQTGGCKKVDIIRQLITDLNHQHKQQNNTILDLCAFVELFPKVSKDELKAWFRPLTNYQKDQQIGKIVDDFTDNLQSVGRWDGKSGLDMTDVEELTRLVFEVSHS